jgi:DNA-binding response OmpR family regulator
MAKILIVEDDANLAQNLSFFLTAQGHRTETADSGRAAIELLEYNGYDLLILDRGLPDFDGVQICATARNKNPSPLVLILTGQKELHQVVHGLGAGADEYMGKPFHLHELDARVRALLRRSARGYTASAGYNGLLLDKVAGQVTFEGRPVSVFPREFKLLALLIEKQDRSVSAKSLMRFMGEEGSPLSPVALKTWLSRLRSKLASLDSALGISHSRDGYQLSYDQSKRIYRELRQNGHS